jgi:predicted nuclease with RNAse H fold
MTELFSPSLCPFKVQPYDTTGVLVVQATETLGGYGGSVEEAMNFVGMDLTTSPRKKTACAVLDAGLHLRDQVLLGSDEEIVAFAEVYRPALIAIDAPLSLPLGLCCLEEACSCQSVSPRKGRQCERELSALGIGCYYTTKRSIIKGMVYRGICLKADLQERGHTVIEVYPYASRLRLFGSLPRKTTVAGRWALQEDLQRLISSVPSPQRELLSHDTLDALQAAYTGFLYGCGETEALGDPLEGLLHIPTSQR